MNMKKIYITLVSFTAAISAFAGQRDTLSIESGLDTISLGYGIEVLDRSSAFVHRGVGRSVFEKAPNIDAAKALYGQIAGDFIRAAIHPADRAFQAFVFCSVLTAGASLYARIRLKRKWKLLRVYFLGVLVLAAYYGGMLYLYLFTMPEEEAVRLAGFSRYACSGMALFAGMLLLCLVKDVENSFAVDIDERGAYRAYSSPGAKRRYSPRRRRRSSG